MMLKPKLKKLKTFLKQLDFRIMKKNLQLIVLSLKNIVVFEDSL